MKGTSLSYSSPDGAQAYGDKERVNAPFRNPDVWENLLPLLPLQSQKILDLGCGIGRDVGEMRRRGAEAYGLDISLYLLEEAKQNEGPWFYQADIFNPIKLPELLTPADGIWSYSVLVHLAPHFLAGVLARWANLLRPGGFMCLNTQMGMDTHFICRKLGNNAPRDMFYHSQATLMAALPAGKIKQIIVREGKSVELQFLTVVWEKPL